MSASTIISRPAMLRGFDLATLYLNLGRQRYVDSRDAADRDVETALVYAISAAQALANAIEELKKLAPESEAARG